MFLLKRKFTGGELLERVFDSLVNEHSYHQIDLPVNEDGDGICTIIANDSDDHRIRLGFMEYKQLSFSEFGKNVWAIGLGKATGSYPARPYCNDIIALELPENPIDNAVEYFVSRIIGSGNFKNSLIHSASSSFVHDGSLRLVGSWKRFADEWNPFGEKILEFETNSNAPTLDGKFGLVAPSFGDRENLLMKLYPLGKKEEKAVYSRRHAKVLTDVFSEVLSSPVNQ
ncbi:MAG: hypothetical protein KKF67_02975 [Nanoarchaeota archaeon]|nr:hypothetical protein [Nanoarchaeota archaeon]